MYDEFLSLEQAKELVLPLLNSESVTCALCGKQFKRILPGHLRTHREFLNPHRKFRRYRPKVAGKKPETGDNQIPSDIEGSETQFAERLETLVEVYERLFGGVDRLTAVVRKLFSLYQPSRSTWRLMEKPILPRYAKWYHVTDDNPAFLPNRLCADIMKQHLQCKCTVAVFPKSKYHTHFVVWDIDATSVPDDPTWHPEQEAKKAAKQIVRLLMKWGLHPHVSVSGSKGFHVTVFFSEGIGIATAKRLFNAVMQHPDGPFPRPGLQFECLPIENAAKLPLGIHWAAERFAMLLDPLTLVPIKDPYEYLLDIVPDSPRVLDKMHDEALAQKRPRKQPIMSNVKWQSESIQAAYKVGIILPGTRHNTLLQVAVHVRNAPSLCPPSFPEFIDVLLEWSREQYRVNGGNIRTSWHEHVEDVYRVAKYVWDRPLSPGIKREVYVTPAIVHWVRQQTSNLAEQRLLFAAWFQSRLVGDTFFFGYERMKRLTSLANDSLDKAIKSLRDNGVLVVAEEYVHSTGLRPSQTRKYRLASEPPKTRVDQAICKVSLDTWQPELWFRLLRTLFTAT